MVQKGVECVADTIDSNCEFLDSNCLEQKYSIKQSNSLETKMADHKIYIGSKY